LEISRVVTSKTEKRKDEGRAGKLQVQNCVANPERQSSYSRESGTRSGGTYPRLTRNNSNSKSLKKKESGQVRVQGQEKRWANNPIPEQNCIGQKHPAESRLQGTLTQRKKREWSQ